MVLIVYDAASPVAGSTVFESIFHFSSLGPLLHVDHLCHIYLDPAYQFPASGLVKRSGNCGPISSPIFSLYAFARPSDDLESLPCQHLETLMHIPFLGSSLGNIPPDEDVTPLRSLPLRPGKRDTLLLGLDHTSDPTSSNGHTTIEQVSHGASSSTGSSTLAG